MPALLKFFGCVGKKEKPVLGADDVIPSPMHKKLDGDNTNSVILPGKKASTPKITENKQLVESTTKQLDTSGVVKDKDELLETNQEPEAEVTGLAPEDIIVKEEEVEKIDEAAVEKVIGEDVPLALNNSPYFHFSPSQLQPPTAVFTEEGTEAGATKDYSSYGFQPTNLLPSFDVSNFDLFKSTNDYLEKQQLENENNSVGEIFSSSKKSEENNVEIDGQGNFIKKEEETAEEEEGNGMPVHFTVDPLNLDNFLLGAAATAGPGSRTNHFSQMEVPKLPQVGVSLPQKIINQIASANLTSSVGELEASVAAVNQELGTLKAPRLQGVVLPGTGTGTGSFGSLLTPRTLSNPMLLGQGGGLVSVLGGIQSGDTTGGGIAEAVIATKIEE